MAKKLLLIIAGIALLLVGAVAGMKFAGDNRGTVVGDTSRYETQSAGGQLTRSVGGSGSGAVHEVRDGDSIQAAVSAAAEGDVIRVYPGTYSETVYIDKDDLVISGVIVAGEWPVMEGNKELNDAVLYSGNDITIENLQIQHYKGNAIMGQAGNNFLVRNNHIIDTGVYGIFPEFGKNGLITHNVLSGIEDAAIYIGMCDNIHVTHNEVFDNVAGIEIENTRHSIVENNYVHDNTGGILVFITPGLPIKTTFDTIVRNNFIVNNNTPNFGIPGSTVAGIPAGTGMSGYHDYHMEEEVYEDLLEGEDELDDRQRVGAEIIGEAFLGAHDVALDVGLLGGERETGGEEDWEGALRRFHAEKIEHRGQDLARRQAELEAGAGLCGVVSQDDAVVVELVVEARDLLGVLGQAVGFARGGGAGDDLGQADHPVGQVVAALGEPGAQQPQDLEQHVEVVDLLVADHVDLTIEVELVVTGQGGAQVLGGVDGGAVAAQKDLGRVLAPLEAQLFVVAGHGAVGGPGLVAHQPGRGVAEGPVALAVDAVAQQDEEGVLVVSRDGEVEDAVGVEIPELRAAQGGTDGLAGWSEEGAVASARAAGGGSTRQRL